ncbi:FlgN family protein [Rhodothermus marinus SG0.5JP17-172]|mgnify:FL=1|uniref:flagellar export chaperone FlgN n=1 Tax=Rhodothermus marinus TaxID=29549 RepID=UPI000223DB32|nr:flagellar export chaperone FlgN [Rhodothermus marinus]AEN72575.1 FlgN family protein [Rhodothermus marinus SG0.5JP17-172]MBO2492348.1 flagellar protein FlgN [Rhodothermus marinus]
MSVPSNILQQFIEAIEEELNLLGQLEQSFEAQLEALRRYDHEALEQAAMQTSELVTRLERLQQKRAGKGRLLRRMLKLELTASTEQLLAALEARSETQAAAHTLRGLQQRLQQQLQQTRQRCESLEFSLKYAIQIGQELLELLQALDQPASRVYTPTGQTRQASPQRSVVNRLG